MYTQKSKSSEKAKPIRTAESLQIKKAVRRAVQEYGKTLEKLAKTD